MISKGWIVDQVLYLCVSFILFVIALIYIIEDVLMNKANKVTRHINSQRQKLLKLIHCNAFIGCILLLLKGIDPVGLHGIYPNAYHSSLIASVNANIIMSTAIIIWYKTWTASNMKLHCDLKVNNKVKIGVISCLSLIWILGIVADLLRIFDVTKKPWLTNNIYFVSIIIGIGISMTFFNIGVNRIYSHVSVVKTTLNIANNPNKEKQVKAIKKLLRFRSLSNIAAILCIILCIVSIITTTIDSSENLPKDTEYDITWAVFPWLQCLCWGILLYYSRIRINYLNCCKQSSYHIDNVSLESTTSIAASESTLTTTI